MTSLPGRLERVNFYSQIVSQSTDTPAFLMATIETHTCLLPESSNILNTANDEKSCGSQHSEISPNLTT